MASFRDILTASDADLVRHFYRLKPTEENDFIKKINHAAAQLDLNHSQLVCSLGFNKHIRDLTDILSTVGFSSYKLLTYRRNELFSTDTYRQLSVDNIVDIYAEHIQDPEIMATLRELLIPRLSKIEEVLEDGNDPGMTISYKMEVHSIYAGGVADADFILKRIESPIGGLREMIDEIQMVIEADLVPASNLFFSDYLLPSETRALIDAEKIDKAMIANRLANEEISEDERQVLEDYV